MLSDRRTKKGSHANRGPFRARAGYVPGMTRRVVPAKPPAKVARTTKAAAPAIISKSAVAKPAKASAAGKATKTAKPAKSAKPKTRISQGKRFAFAGGFDCCPAGLDDTMLVKMVEAAGGIAATDIDATLDYLVVGNRRGDKKIARVNEVKRLVEKGADITVIDEGKFLTLTRIKTPTDGTGELDFPTFINQLYACGDRGKVGRALDMLRKDRFQLYAHVQPEHLVGVVRSQSGSGSVYASWLDKDGHYGCSQPDLEDCMGLQGSTCKHLMVLVVGLARTNQMTMAQALAWMRAAKGESPRKNTTLCAETLIQYKGAQAGEVDWRPTETIPEDFYAM